MRGTWRDRQGLRSYGNSLGPGWRESRGDLRLSGGWPRYADERSRQACGVDITARSPGDLIVGDDAGNFCSPKASDPEDAGSTGCAQEHGEPSGQDEIEPPPEGLGGKRIRSPKYYDRAPFQRAR